MSTIIVSTKSRKQDRREELTESELSNVSGGGGKTSARAGNVTYNSISITKHIDAASTNLF
jgi:bacteriocin-like protein